MPQTFDALFGADQPTINLVATAVFNALKPSGLFDPTIDVNEVDITTVHVNIKKPFVITLLAPSHLATNLRKAIADQKVPKKNADLMLAATHPISFTVTAPAIDVTINYSSGGSPTFLPNCSLSVGALVSTDASAGTLTFQASSALVNTGNKVMDEILNKSVVPYLVTYLDKNVFTPIKVPTLSVKGVTISLPVPSIQQPFLLAFAALGPIQPDPIPLFTGYPKGKVFVGVDAALLLAGANAELPITDGSTFSWTVFTGDYGVSLGPVTAVQIQSDASIQATVKANAYFDITFHTPWPFPNFSWSPSATATITADASVSVVNNELVVTYDSVSPPSFDFDWGSLDWVDWLLDPLLDALGDALGEIVAPIVNAILEGKQFNVMTIPSFTVDGIKVSLGNVQAIFLNVAGKPMLIAEGLPTITKA